MEFYSEPAFFVLFAVALVPAVALGMAQRRIKYWGLAVSLLFDALLFMRSPHGLVALLIFLALALSVTFGYRCLERKRAEKMAAANDCAHAGAKAAAAALPKAASAASAKAASAALASADAVANADAKLALSGLGAKAALRPLRYWPGVALIVMPLAVYKAAAVFDADILGFVGISYITFRAVQVLLETKDGLIDRLTVPDYLYFLLFFAPFTSGPIDRSRRFVEDANAAPSRQAYLDMLAKGVSLLLLGVLYKTVISAVIFDAYSWTPTRATTALFDVALGFADMYAYGVYLFFDFAGYSLMAMGAGYCFGIAVPRNFKAPFLAVDIKDFWNRWHITLSHWLRDFVFMRFTKTALRKKWFSSRVTPACLGYLVNMTVMGAWHGLTMDYLAYGLYHGVLLALTELMQKRWAFYKRHHAKPWFKAASWAVTMNLAFIGFAIFSGQARGVLAAL
jgi:membrane protein involved in D-alanine export